jgi:LPXTG-site transpeptidase (sortase) family protein
MHNDTERSGLIFHSKLEQRVTFFLVCMGVIAVTYGVLFAIDFLPEAPTEEVSAVETVTKDTDVQEVSENTDTVDPLPTRIIFDSLDREVAILNPNESTNEALDAALLSGVVRHPDSADFANTGTIFLLGHSSYLPVVHNKNFQAFNGIQKLEWGDTVRLLSSDTEYVYRVDRVYEAKASSAEVPLQFDEATLILATCNSFGSKDDRFIVEAKLVSKRSLDTESTPKS